MFSHHRIFSVKNLSPLVCFGNLDFALPLEHRSVVNMGYGLAIWQSMLLVCRNPATQTWHCPASLRKVRAEALRAFHALKFRVSTVLSCGEGAFCKCREVTAASRGLRYQGCRKP